MAVTIYPTDSNDDLIVRAASTLLATMKVDLALAATQKELETLRNDKKKLNSPAHKGTILLYVTTMGKLAAASSEVNADLAEYKKELTLRNLEKFEEKIKEQASIKLAEELESRSASKGTLRSSSDAPIARRQSDQNFAKKRDDETETLLKRRSLGSTK